MKLRHPPVRMPASDIHGLCLSCRGAAAIPLVDPRGISYVDMYKYHESAQVMASDKGYGHCIYLGYEGDFQRLQFIATGGHRILSCAYVQYCSSDWGKPKVGSPNMRCTQ